MSYITCGSKNCAVSEVSYVRVDGTWALDVVDEVVEVLGVSVETLLLVVPMLVVLELVVVVVLCTPLVAI